MCQHAGYLNSDRYDRSQTTDLNNSPTRYHPTTAFTAFYCLQFSMWAYLAAERFARWTCLAAQRFCGGRGVRAVGVATLNANSVNKKMINAKSEPSKCSGMAISRHRQIYARIGVELRSQG